jgi:biopolymer transport protein ExbD
MALGSQTLKAGSFNRHIVTRKHKKKSRKRLLIAGLTLTSMVDMFSLLVIFLLQSFSTSPELLMVTKGVTLPAAVSGRELLDAPVLSLSATGAYLDQKLVGKLEELANDPTPLMEKLSQLRELWQKTHPNEKFRGEISLQADRDLPSTTVSQFMGMLPSQNYGLIQMAVVAKGK